METERIQKNDEEMLSLCHRVRELAGRGDIKGGQSIAVRAMSAYPNAPQPHNLLGVLLEKQGDHLLAMKHFRAAYALDPTYGPARQNLDHYGTFFSAGHCAFDESDCPTERSNTSKAAHGENSFGRVTDNG